MFIPRKISFHFPDDKHKLIFHEFLTASAHWVMMSYYPAIWLIAVQHGKTSFMCVSGSNYTEEDCFDVQTELLVTQTTALESNIVLLIRAQSD